MSFTSQIISYNPYIYIYIFVWYIYVLYVINCYKVHSLIVTLYMASENFLSMTAWVLGFSISRSIKDIAAILELHFDVS